MSRDKRCPFCGKQPQILEASGLRGYWPSVDQARCPDENCANEWMDREKWNTRDIEVAEETWFNRPHHDVEEFYE